MTLHEAIEKHGKQEGIEHLIFSEEADNKEAVLRFMHEYQGTHPYTSFVLYYVGVSSIDTFIQPGVKCTEIDKKLMDYYKEHKDWIMELIAKEKAEEEKEETNIGEK